MEVIKIPARINIPAIRAELGTIVYYTTTFTFKQIAERVKRIDDELHISHSLDTQIQRTLTENYKSISEYIQLQKEHFFNALVLAVYDGDPEWNEVEIEFEEQSFITMGFLTLSGEEKIFPVDGQHRVEGIKDALYKKPEIGNEKISVILIGHQKTKKGMERTRRIFTTLNRYAKPVQLGDLITLDEDDIVAIITRDLLISYPLFNENKIRSIDDDTLLNNDFDSFTSLITLYNCNVEIFKYYLYKKDNKKYNEKEIDQYLKYRRAQNEIDDFKTYLVDFWDSFSLYFEGIKEFRDSNLKSGAAKRYRNYQDGGLLYFWPNALRALVKSILETCQRTNLSQEVVMLNYSELEYHLNKELWKEFLGDRLSKIKEMMDEGSILLLLMFMYTKDGTLLNTKEINDLLKIYAVETNKKQDSVFFTLNSYKIERAALRAVEMYINSLDKMEINISTNDKTPIWDGILLVYKNKQHTVNNYFAQVPVVVKGTTNTKDDFYRIEREYLEGYKYDGGCIFFLVQEEKESFKILYALLSYDTLNTMLKQNTKTIKIGLVPIPVDPLAFENEVCKFARKRNGKKFDNPATKEIESLVKKFKEVEKHLNEIEDDSARLNLELLLNIIKKLKDDGTVGWRDKFIYYSQEAIELAINNIKGYDFTNNNIKGYDFTNLQFELGAYLHKQKQYHLAEDYYLKTLEEYRERSKDNLAEHKNDMAMALNNLASLHYDLNHHVEAELEYREALEIRRGLAKDNPDAYMGEVATTLNNLGLLHSDLNRPVEAEEEYKEALEIRRRLAKDNPDAYLGEVAMTLNNLAALHHSLNRPVEAEEEYKEALEIRRRLAKDNPDAYMGDVATTLNNLAALHHSLNRPVEAEGEYKLALEIRRRLAEDNPDAYMGEVATTLNNLAALHHSLNRLVKAEGEYKQALEIRRRLAKDNPDAYIGDIATTINNLANLHLSLNRPIEADEELMEALDIIWKLAKDNPAAYIGDVATTLDNLANLHLSLNRLPEAEEKYEEALEIYRKLAKNNPAAYMGDVAMTLNNLGILHKNLNRLVEAEGEYKEALEIRRRLAEDNPDAYLGEVAMTLNNLAALHHSLNRPVEAEEEYKEALEIRRRLAKDNPAAYMGDVATTLNNLAELHRSLNRLVEAEGEYKEALEIRRGLAKDNPDAYMGDVATTLNNLAKLHRSLNRLVEAEGEYKLALEIYRGLAKNNPAVYMDKAADTLNCLAYLYASQKGFAKAIDSIDQAIVFMPENAEYYDSKGEILLMNGDEQGAVKLWHKVMELDPDFLSKYNGETELHRQLKERGLIEE